MAYRAKRQFKRASLREGVRVMTPKGPLYATSDDLSAGGVRLKLDQELSPGSLVEVELSLRGSRGRFLSEIKTLARVVRSVKNADGFSVGLQFVDLNDSARQLIQALNVDDLDGPF